jgi:multiple antibiotic resistance protein
VIQSLIAEAFTFFLLAFPALFSIINPLGGAFIFLAATSHLAPRVRNKMARKIAFYSFVTLVVSMLIGAYVLKVFGISMPVLRVAGGIVIALSAWKMLTADDEGEKQKAALEDASGREAEHMAFYPLTMPVTTGPGTISVAIALGTGSARRPVLFALEAFATAALICLLIYWFYAGSSRLAKAVGPTGTSIIARLSAFLLFCIGIQVLWTGFAELLTTLPHVP